MYDMLSTATLHSSSNSHRSWKRWWQSPWATILLAVFVLHALLVAQPFYAKRSNAKFAAQQIVENVCSSSSGGVVGVANAGASALASYPPVAQLCMDQRVLADTAVLPLVINDTIDCFFTHLPLVNFLSFFLNQSLLTQALLLFIVSVCAFVALYIYMCMFSDAGGYQRPDLALLAALLSSGCNAKKKV